MRRYTDVVRVGKFSTNVEKNSEVRREPPQIAGLWRLFMCGP
jgi:hypothetical protein